MKKGIHIVYLKKQKEVYVTILLFILYSIWICVFVSTIFNEGAYLT